MTSITSRARHSGKTAKGQYYCAANTAMLDITERTTEKNRHEINSQLDPIKRSRLGQFMTPSVIADFMASLFSRWPDKVRLLDPGAGVGSLTEAFARRFITQAPDGAVLDVHCFEIEHLLAEYLAGHLKEIDHDFSGNGKSFRWTIHDRDFIDEACFRSNFGNGGFTHAILNPPYKKISSNSEHRKLLRTAGIETVNLYTAFLGLTIAVMEKNGEIVAIVPRSFCNGTYFRPFRKFLLEKTAITHIHVFESRKRAFKDDNVLQENIIIHLVRGAKQGSVIISTSHDPSFTDYKKREFPFLEIVKSGDAEKFIHIPTLDVNGAAHLFTHSLADLGLEVSTGPVVDFRVKKHWLADPSGNCVPLLYTHHFKGGDFIWPKSHKKPNALKLNDDTRKWLMPRGWYTVTKRFSSKEERRRLVAFVLDPGQLAYELFGFENHLNVIHARKKGIPADIAHGLAVFLNSTVVDQYFRNFSGHTQVNATDLRSMRYPSRPALIRLGKWARKQKQLTQKIIDKYIESIHGK